MGALFGLHKAIPAHGSWSRTECDVWGRMENGCSDERVTWPYVRSRAYPTARATSSVPAHTTRDAQGGRLLRDDGHACDVIGAQNISVMRWIGQGRHLSMSRPWGSSHTAHTYAAPQQIPHRHTQPRSTRPAPCSLPLAHKNTPCNSEQRYHHRELSWQAAAARQSAPSNGPT